MSSHDSSGDIFKMDDLTSAINLIATSEPASADCNAKENQAPTLPPILQSSSMSRRRLGTNIPSLQCHIGLPPPPADSYFKELMHPVSPRKGPRRSLGFTIKSPNLLSVRPTNLPAVPVTPVDQMINVPSQPPEAPRQSVKKPTAYGAEFEKAWGFSPDVMPPLTSPNLEDSPQVPSAALLDSVPITPVEQVMAVPNVPPKLPRRRTSTATARDPLSTAKCLPLNALYPSTQATPTQRSKITSPKLSMTCVPSHITVPRFSKLAISDTDHISPFIDVGKTPKPRNSASSRTPKPRPPPLFTLPARSTHVPTPRTQRPLSPASPLAHGPGVARLPLASPFWPAITGDNCSFAGVRTSTPLAGVAKRAPAETSAVGTPSYFNAPSYFVNN